MRSSRLIRAFFFLVTFGLTMHMPGAALAAGSGGPPQTLTQVIVEGNRIFVYSPVAFANPDSCSTSGYAVIDSTTLQQPDWVASTILSAFNAGKKMAFYFQGCVATNWNPSVPLATTFYLLP